MWRQKRSEANVAIQIERENTLQSDLSCRVTAAAVTKACSSFITSCKVSLALILWEIP